MRFAYLSVGLAALANAKPVSKRSTETGNFQSTAGPVTSLHCYLDQSARLLTHTPSSYPSGVTPETCALACANDGFPYSGVEYGGECYCDYTIDNSHALTQSGDNGCNMPCSASTSETCGGSWRLNVYQTTLNSIGNAANGADSNGQQRSYLGCFTDSVSSRNLPDSQVIPNVTPQKCALACATLNYTYSGVEYSAECYCSHVAPSGSAQTDGSCDMVCNGDHTLWCGGPDRVSVYQTVIDPTKVNIPTPAAPVLPTGVTEIGSYTTNGVAITNLGCFHDTGSSGANRTLPINPAGIDPTTLTVQLCVQACVNEGFQYAGIEYSAECYCANDIDLTQALGHHNAACSMVAAGDPTQVAGGPWALNVYGINAGNGIVADYTEGSNSIHYLNCYIDNINNRTFNFTVVDIPTEGMNVGDCVDSCIEGGFRYAGLEWAQECYCSATLPPSSFVASDPSTCSYPCTLYSQGNGGTYQICGGSNRLSVYDTQYAAT